MFRSRYYKIKQKYNTQKLKSSYLIAYKYNSECKKINLFT